MPNVWRFNLNLRTSALHRLIIHWNKALGEPVRTQTPKDLCLRFYYPPNHPQKPGLLGKILHKLRGNPTDALTTLCSPGCKTRRDKDTICLTRQHYSARSRSSHPGLQHMSLDNSIRNTGLFNSDSTETICKSTAIFRPIRFHRFSAVIVVISMQAVCLTSFSAHIMITISSLALF